MQRPGPRLDSDTAVVVARETVILVRDLLMVWIEDQEGQNEVPLTAMRDWHRMTKVLEETG